MLAGSADEAGDDMLEDACTSAGNSGRISGAGPAAAGCCCCLPPACPGVTTTTGAPPVTGGFHGCELPTLPRPGALPGHVCALPGLAPPALTTGESGGKDAPCCDGARDCCASVGASGGYHATAACGKRSSSQK